MVRGRNIVFPRDVRGVYDTPEREVGEASGHTKKYSVSAKVGHNTIIFVASPKLGTDVRVYSINNNSAGYTNLDQSELENGTMETATVRIDSHKNYADGDAPTPIVFKGTGGTVKRDMPGGKETTPVFEFKYVIPHIGGN